MSVDVIQIIQLTVSHLDLENGDSMFCMMLKLVLLNGCSYKEACGHQAPITAQC